MTTVFWRARQADIAAMSRIRLSVSENVLSDPARVTLQMYEDYLEPATLARRPVAWRSRKPQQGDRNR